jgi:hypothetical protein
VTRQLVHDGQHAARTRFYKDGEALDRGVTDVEPWGNERGRHLRIIRSRRRRLAGVDGLLHLGAPGLQCSLRLGRPLVVRSAHLLYVVAAAALDPSQHPTHNVEARRLAGAGEADDGRPQAYRLRPGS